MNIFYFVGKALEYEISTCHPHADPETLDTFVRQVYTKLRYTYICTNVNYLLIMFAVCIKTKVLAARDRLISEPHSRGNSDIHYTC